MSVKSRFLEKLQTRQPAPASPASKSQIDIAEFCQRVAQLQKQMDAWLEGTGLNVETLTTSVTDLLVEGGAFEVTGITVYVDDRSVKFTPVFLYGKGVTGCVEVTLHAEGCVMSLGRLFMRAGYFSDWTFTPPEMLRHTVQPFDENTFFSLILALLP